MDKIMEHPSVKKAAQKGLIGRHSDVSTLKADELRQLCLKAGADDVGFVHIQSTELEGERQHILDLFPQAETLISVVCKMQQQNMRSTSRSIANNELHYTGHRIDNAASVIAKELQKMGISALSPAAAFPMEMEKWPGRMWSVSHKIVAEAAGMGRMGLHRSIIHPMFGSNILLATVVVAAKLDNYGSPLDYSPCLDCKLCAAACPTGAIHEDGHYSFVNCMVHTYRYLMGGFIDWVELLAQSKNAKNYRHTVHDRETVYMWQSLAIGPCYRSTYCIAVCPAGEEVVGEFVADRKGYIESIVRPLQHKAEDIYVIPGSDVASHVEKRFPSKQTRMVGSGVRPGSISSFLQAMPLVYQRGQARGLNVTYHFIFTGEEEVEATVYLSETGVKVVPGLTESADLQLKADSRAWLRFLHKETSIILQMALRNVRVKGPISLLKTFARCFPL